MFAHQVRREDMQAVFLEYAWDMSWCDPCAAEPLSTVELRKLGVFWLALPQPNQRFDRRLAAIPADVFVTRLHVRYDAAHFPEDLVFQETGDRTNFQGRFVMRQPWTGPANCPEAETYARELRARQEREAQTLASMTGWNLDEIRRRIGLGGPVAAGPPPAPWWSQIWK
jgi:hypothetical protein